MKKLLLILLTAQLLYGSNGHLKGLDHQGVTPSTNREDIFWYPKEGG